MLIIIIINNLKSYNYEQIETQFLPGSGCIDSAIWMHYMDAN